MCVVVGFVLLLRVALRCVALRCVAFSVYVFRLRVLCCGVVFAWCCVCSVL